MLGKLNILCKKKIKGLYHADMCLENWIFFARKIKGLYYVDICLEIWIFFARKIKGLNYVNICLENWIFFYLQSWTPLGKRSSVPWGNSTCEVARASSSCFPSLTVHPSWSWVASTSRSWGSRTGTSSRCSWSQTRAIWNTWER